MVVSRYLLSTIIAQTTSWTWLLCFGQTGLWMVVFLVSTSFVFTTRLTDTCKLATAICQISLGALEKVAKVTFILFLKFEKFKKFPPP